MQMRSIYAMCLVPCAMWQSTYAKDQVFITMDSFKDIMFLSFVSFLCVQVSLWMLILMIIFHIRNLYMWESAYLYLIYVRLLPVHGIVSFWFFDGSGKRMGSECLHVILISLHSGVFGCSLDPFLAWWSYWILLVYLVQNMFFGSLECVILLFYLLVTFYGSPI